MFGLDHCGTSGTSSAFVMEEVMPSTETALTTFTSEGFLVSVDQHMRFELIGIGEFRLAELTSIWSFSSVDTEMSP